MAFSFLGIFSLFQFVGDGEVSFRFLFATVSEASDELNDWNGSRAGIKIHQ